MDVASAAAARALAAGDPLGALEPVALRDDPPALALRGIAMAQLGDLARARLLLRRAARAFGPRAVVARARCLLAEAEVAVAARELDWPAAALEAARETLEAHGDRANAAHARQLGARRLLLLGRLDEAERALAGLEAGALPPVLRTIHELLSALIAMRRVRAQVARVAIARARRAALQAGIPALGAEVERARRALVSPVARLLGRDGGRLLRLDEVEALLASGALVVDACRHEVRCGRDAVPLARRPVLFALARTLGEAWPDDVPREALLARAFRAMRADESHRARLRVEIGRLRRLLQGLGSVAATRRGFVLSPDRSHEVVVLTRPVEEPDADLLALLADGEAWSSSALGLALGRSQRSVQRALDRLAGGGKVAGLGRGRARRWTTPPAPGLATTLLLPVPLPGS